MTILALIAFIDEVGKLRWFWPYDGTVFSIALLIIFLWYVIFGEQFRTWFKDEQAKLDQEDERQ
jgi:hypothetical protein